MRDEHFVPCALWVEGETHAQSGPMKKMGKRALTTELLSIQMFPEKVLDALIHSPKDFLSRQTTEYNC